MYNSHNTTTTINNNPTINNNNTFIVVGNELGDLVRAGTVTESELIQRTILENADLRRQMRTVENIPGAVFHVTKGRSGPQRLRNVKMDGRRVAELWPEGVRTFTKTEYCKSTALRILEALQDAIASVGEDAPEALREWAREVSAALRRKMHNDIDYVTALRLYAEASSTFYKLPSEIRDPVSIGVTNIGNYIANAGTFQ